MKQVVEKWGMKQSINPHILHGDPQLMASLEADLGRRCESAANDAGYMPIEPARVRVLESWTAVGIPDGELPMHEWPMMFADVRVVKKAKQ